MADRPTFTHGALVPQVEALLRQYLRAGRWAAGEKLPSETALAAELGVGRSSMREAVRLLVRDGLVEVRHGAGTLVAGPERATADTADMAGLLRRARLVEVYEIRRALEVEAARLTARRARREDLSGLRERLRERAAHATDPASFVRIDLDFHEAVVALSGNSVLLDLFRIARPIIESALVDRISADGHLPNTDHEHEHLLDALERGDADAAVAATQHNLAAVLDSEPAAERDVAP